MKASLAGFIKKKSFFVNVFMLNKETSKRLQRIFSGTNVGHCLT